METGYDIMAHCVTLKHCRKNQSESGLMMSQCDHVVVSLTARQPVIHVYVYYKNRVLEILYSEFSCQCGCDEIYNIILFHIQLNCILIARRIDEVDKSQMPNGNEGAHYSKILFDDLPFWVPYRNDQLNYYQVSN